MLKSIQFKIVISFLIVGLIFIMSLGIVNIYNLQIIKSDITAELEINHINNVIDNQISNIKIISLCIILGFILFMILIGLFVSKVIISPISNLIMSAEQATKGVKYLSNGKSKNEINNLVSAFDSINNELKENLNETTRQKKQMETILLHMTDGIIAFNIEGKIIHINPAAKTFLNLTNETKFEENKS